MRTPARRRRLRYLPAFLGLLIPVATLAWLGSAELGRHRQRAARAMTDHAATVVDGATRELTHAVDRHTRAVIERDIDARFEPLVRVDERVTADLPFALGLVVLDPSGGLVYPETPPDDPMTVPFREPDPSAELRAAEQLIAASDFEGARGILEDLVDNMFRRRRNRHSRPSFASYRRALFRLGTVQLRLGSLDDAEVALDAARRPGRVSRPEVAVPLLCDTVLAEIESLRDPTAGVAALVGIMRRIACGEHYLAVGDELLTTTLHHLRSIVERLRDDLPPTADGLLADMEGCFATDGIRRRGRSFALDYRDFLRETLRRQLRARGADDGPIFVCHAGEDRHETSLLVLREVRDAERKTSPMALGETAAFIGMRFDFEKVFQEVVVATATDSGGDFYLAIENADGTPLLPRVVPTREDTGLLDFEPPRRRCLAGTVLRAEPADPKSFLDADRRSQRALALLILALCAVAGGGAWLLVRTASRESELAAVKMQLVSRVSHELRTPLALIKMYAETIVRDNRSDAPGDPQSEQTLRFAEIIDREADRLAATVRRILDFSSAESTPTDAHHLAGPLDLAALVTSVTDAYRPQATARDVDLFVSVPDDATALAGVDRNGCESALLNLLENAVKYSYPHPRPTTASEPGAIAAPVEIALVVDQEHSVASLTVADRGIGIPGGELDAVFDSFHRAANAMEAPGVGLGLHLVRNFARAHGGDVVADRRTDGDGTIMTLTLPIHPPSR